MNIDIELVRLVLLLVLVLLIAHPIRAQDEETVDQCEDPARTIFLNIARLNGNYAFTASETKVIDGVCNAFELINYDHDPNNDTMFAHHFDMLESENTGILDVHRSFPTDGSHKTIHISIPEGLDQIVIFCGDDNHRELGLNITFATVSAPRTIPTLTTSSRTPNFPTITSKRIIIPGFGLNTLIFPILMIVFLSTRQKRRVN